MKTYDDCIIFLLAKAYQKAHGNFKKCLHTYGLTPMQHLILEALWKEDGLSASDIGNKLVLDGATLSGVLDRLTLCGWILKKSDAEDKRVNLTFLPSLRTLRNAERVLHNQTVDKVLEIENRGNTKIEDIVPYVSGLVGKKMLEDGQMDQGVLSAGQSMGFVHDIPTCREPLDRIMTQAEAIIKEKFAQVISQLSNTQFIRR